MMHVVVMEARLDLPGIRSLKEKRGVVKGLLERIRHKFEVAAAEVANQDHWGTAGLGFAVVGNDAKILVGRLEQVAAYLRESVPGFLGDYRIEVL